MKKIISIFMMMVIVCMGMAAKPKSGGGTPPPPKMGTFNVTIYCAENDAKVYLDGEVAGFPNRAFTLKQGGHTIRVVKDGFVDYETKIIVEKDMTITADMRKHDAKPHHMPPPPPPKAKEWTLTVNTSEPDCKIYLNNDLLGMSNKPYRVKEGSYIVKIEKDGIEKTEGVTLDSDKSIFVRMERPHHNPPPPRTREYNVVISTSEPGCTISLNGVVLGESNKSYKIKEGSYLIKAEKKGFKDAVDGITVDSDKNIFLKMERPPRNPPKQPPQVKEYTLMISTSEPDCKVFLNGEYLGESNRMYKIKEGSYLIKVTKDGFEDALEGVNMKEDKSVFIRMNAHETTTTTTTVMEQSSTRPSHHGPRHHDRRPDVKYYDLTINCEEDDATVFIDDEEWGKPNQTFTVEMGNRKIKVVKRGFEPFEMLVSCDTNRTVNAKLKPMRRR